MYEYVYYERFYRQKYAKKIAANNIENLNTSTFHMS